jgi:aminoglycoside/choline kinase family phosphotransferase
MNPDTARAGTELPTVAWPDDTRRQRCEGWLQSLPASWGLQPVSLRLASADASFRRYLRIDSASGPLILMDAPPPLEDVRPFIDIGQRLLQAGLHTPRVLASDTEHGFVLLEDLGDQLYLQALTQPTSTPAQAEGLMRDAIAALVQMQVRTRKEGLPVYDEALLMREMALFPEWCVQREFGVTWGDREQALWQRVTRALVDSALAQPTVFVHRDWMPRNLMISTPNPGVLDFQDAVQGPATYDIASLLRDAFWSWDDEALEIDWAVRWWQSGRAAGLDLPEDFGETWRQIEWMGAQRHLKVAGIFCRLKHRDGKARYAEDLPRFFRYLTKAAMRYRPLAPLLPLIEPLSGQRVSEGFTF